MAEAAKRRAIAQQRGASVPDQTGTDDKAKDLDNVETQAKILDPEHGFIKIGGKEVRIHKLSARYAKRLAALAVQISQDSANTLLHYDPSAKGAVTSVARAGALVAGKYADEFLPLLVHAQHEPGAYNDFQATALAQNLEDSITYQETQAAYFEMLGLNKTFEMIGVNIEAIKKRPPQPPKGG